MHEKKNNDKTKKSYEFVLKSAKSTVQTKITSLIKQAPCLNPGRIWTNSKSSDESMNHNKVTANLKPQTALFILEKTAMEKYSRNTQNRRKKPSSARKTLSIWRKPPHRRTKQLYVGCLVH